MSEPVEGLSAEGARATYVSSCKELMSAINTLESSLINFVGKEEVIKVRRPACRV